MHACVCRLTWHVTTHVFDRIKAHKYKPHEREPISADFMHGITIKWSNSAACVSARECALLIILMLSEF